MGAAHAGRGCRHRGRDPVVVAVAHPAASTRTRAGVRPCAVARGRPGRRTPRPRTGRRAATWTRSFRRPAVAPVTPTRPWVLVLLAAVAGAIAYVLTAQFYADVPSPPTYAPLSLLLIALAEAYLASSTRARMLGRPGTRPVEPIYVAK